MGTERRAGVVAVGLAFLRTVDAAESDTFRVVVVQDFDGVAVEDGHDLAGEIGKGCRGCQEEQRVAIHQVHHQSHPQQGLSRPSQHKARPFPHPHTPP